MLDGGVLDEKFWEDNIAISNVLGALVKEESGNIIDHVEYSGIS